MLAEAEAAEEAARIKAEVAMTEANKQRASLQMAMHDAQVRAAAAAANLDSVERTNSAFLHGIFDTGAD